MKKPRSAPAILVHLPEILSRLSEQAKGWEAPVAGKFASEENPAFKILISTVLSLRTKDTTTEPASRRLFARAATAQDLLEVPIPEIEKLIYPVGFYHTKAKNIHSICRDLIERFEGKVPDEIDALLTLRGVGRKTANLVVTVGYGKPGICVDTHVHRISNRWGLVRSKSPDETEMKLRNILPKRYWIGFNDLLVSFGQNLCVPVSPFCSRCRMREFCPRNGVKTSR